jgi:hypothetical protein
VASDSREQNREGDPKDLALMDFTSFHSPE